MDLHAQIHKQHESAISAIESSTLPEHVKALLVNQTFQFSINTLVTWNSL